MQIHALSREESEPFFRGKQPFGPPGSQRISTLGEYVSMAPLVKKNRRALRKNKSSKVKSSLCFVGINSAGLSSKLESFDALLNSINPSVFFIQETKLKQQGKIKTEQSKKYQIFELNRKEKAGGGLAIGALDEVKPVWISEGDDNLEILVVELYQTEKQDQDAADEIFI